MLGPSGLSINHAARCDSMAGRGLAPKKSHSRGGKS
jgi:hypothetical protein